MRPPSSARPALIRSSMSRRPGDQPRLTGLASPQDRCRWSRPRRTAVATGDVPPPAEGQHDLYLLRDLTRCELCKHHMVPVLLIGVRYYGCTSPTCIRPLVPAEGL